MSHTQPIYTDCHNCGSSDHAGFACPCQCHAKAPKLLLTTPNGKTPTERTTWELWTYDVWGNARDGYEVNDRYCHARALKLNLPIEVCNAGTPQQFTTAYPSDRQIRKAFGLARNLKLETDGDDLSIYVSRSRDGYPIGELLCVSHESLSPIRRKLEASTSDTSSTTTL